MGGFAANRDYAASNSSRHSLASISVDPCVCRGLESRQNWMKIRSICLALFMLGHAGGMCAQNSEAFTPIGQSAVTTLHVPGFADFLVADGDAVWATNQGCVEKLERDHPGPVATVSGHSPSITLFRIHLKPGRRLCS